MTFYVSQQVVCVRARARATDTNGFDRMESPHPVKGEVVTISGINAVKSGDIIGALEFTGDYLFLCFVEYGYGQWFEASDFRPVKTTSIEVFRKLLVTPPKVDA